MKTIEERAVQASDGYDDQAYSVGLYMGYTVGAKEQRQFDIERASLWLKCRSEYPFSDEIIDGFRKFMEE